MFLCSNTDIPLQMGFWGKKIGNRQTDSIKGHGAQQN